MDRVTVELEVPEGTRERWEQAGGRPDPGQRRLELAGVDLDLLVLLREGRARVEGVRHGDGQ